jgi:D-alanyl-D-alanine carboxypeptidase (penicillin-binding protein 5/6)
MSLEFVPVAPPPPARRRRRRRGLIAGITALVVAALLGGYATWTLTAPIGSATIEAEAPEVTVPAAAQLALSTDATASALSVIGGEQYLGEEASGIWAATGGDEPRPIASITKLITALVILDAKPLAAGEAGPTITFDRDDHALYDKYYVLGASIAAMPIGSSLSQHDALEAMLIVSACNYAEAVSNWAFGSQSAFLRAARDWLAAQGLAHTTIVEPTGLDARNTSSPSDLIALGRIARANPVIAEITQMSALTVPTIPPTLSTNELLGTDGVTGIKTGTLEGTGSNLLFSATVEVGTGEALDVVGVILGGYTDESVNLDVRALLASIRDGFHEVPLAEEGQVVGRYTTPWEESADVVLGESASVLTWSDTPVTSTFRVDTLATGESGDTVGEITWVAGPTTVSVPLVLAGDIEPPTAWWRPTHPFDLGG